MTPYHVIYHNLIQKVKDSSKKEVATRVVYDPKTGLSITYYEDKPIKEVPYKTDIKWKD